MKPVDLLPTLRNIEIAWVDLANSYQAIGEDKKARKLLDELKALTQTHSDESVYKQKYFKHLEQWEKKGYVDRSRYNA